MEQSKRIAALAESEEERYRLELVCGRMERAKEREIPAASCFLSLREQALVRLLLPDCRFFGGTAETERAVAFYLPEYLTQEDYFLDGPIACLRAHFYEENTLTHRDVLGALMGAGIRRETVGDICLHGRTCDIFVLAELKKYLLDNLVSAGRVYLRLEEIPLAQAERLPQKLRELRLTVSSLRLDALVSAAFHLSRGRAVELICGGAAAVNSLTCLKPDRSVAQEDVISLRGLGKLRLLECGGMTKKGRIALTVGKYV